MAGSRRTKREGDVTKSDRSKKEQSSGASSQRVAVEPTGSPPLRVEFTRPPPVPGEQRNYSVMNLDDVDVAHSSWRSTIRQYRLWCFNTSSERYRFGDDRRRSCMLPETGHFLVYIHYHKKWMIAVIDCSSGYLDGYITKSVITKSRGGKKSQLIPKELRIQEHHSQNATPTAPTYIEHAALLPWDGSYRFASSCKFGYGALVNAFNSMYKRIEQKIPAPKDDQVIHDGEVFILHLPECARSDKLFRKADTNFVNGIRVGDDPVEEAQYWSDRSKDALEVMHDVTPDRWAAKRRGKAAALETQSVCDKLFGVGLEKQLQIIEDLRLFYRQGPQHPRFELKDLPVHLSSTGPVPALDIHSKEGSEKNNLSEFLIQPFLQFNRLPQEDGEDDEPYENQQSGAVLDQVEKNSDDIPEKQKQSSFAFRQNDGVKANMIEQYEKSVGTLDDNLTGVFKDFCRVMLENQVKVSEGTKNNSSAGTSDLGQTCSTSSALQYVRIGNQKVSEGAKENNSPGLGPTCSTSSALQYVQIGNQKVSEGAKENNSSGLRYDNQKVSEGTQENNSSAGIYNLGQTCYASSALQYLHSVPELRPILDGCTAGGRSEWVHEKSYNLTAALQNVIKQLADSTKPVYPHAFMEALGERDPTFKEKQGCLYRQQDVAECIDVLVSTLRETIAIDRSGAASDLIRTILGIEVTSREQPGEDGLQSKQVVYSLNCPITDDTDNLQKGLERGLDILGGRLNDLPNYLTIHLSRVNSIESGPGEKNLTEVKYPAELNVYDLCSEELKNAFQSNKGTSLVVNESHSAHNKADSHELVEEKSGIFDLIALIAHEGENATSGHYDSFIKQDNNNWIRFDDEKKSIVTGDDVLGFTGAGGSTKTACTCLYKARAEC